jgi:hypothetical protein
MKTTGQVTKIIFVVIWVLLVALGIYTANKTNQHDLIANGILGLAVLYLLYFYLRYSGIDASLDTMLSDPRVYRYLIYAFVGPYLAYLAIGGVFDLISLIVKTW